MERGLDQSLTGSSLKVTDFGLLELLFGSDFRCSSCMELLGEEICEGLIMEGLASDGCCSMGSLRMGKTGFVFKVMSDLEIMGQILLQKQFIVHLRG